MIIILNGPLGVGKSTLAEALMESIDGCVMLDGDHLVAANPPPADSREHLHATIVLMVAHHQRFGYRHFVVNHYWDSADALDDLRRRLCSIGIPDEVRCFLLTLPLEENLRRIERRQGARALDEREFEARTSSEERDALARATGDELGEVFDVSASPDVLVTAMLRAHRAGRLALRSTDRQSAHAAGCSVVRSSRRSTPGLLCSIKYLTYA